MDVTHTASELALETLPSQYSTRPAQSTQRRRSRGVPVNTLRRSQSPEAEAPYRRLRTSVRRNQSPEADSPAFPLKYHGLDSGVSSIDRVRWYVSSAFSQKPR